MDWSNPKIIEIKKRRDEIKIGKEKRKFASLRNVMPDYSVYL
jgi:hypothetical protein